MCNITERLKKEIQASGALIDGLYLKKFFK